MEPKKCPKCGVVVVTRAAIDQLFGYRNVGGKQRLQSYCKNCRAAKPKVVVSKDTKIEVEFAPGKLIEPVENAQPPRAIVLKPLKLDLAPGAVANLGLTDSDVVEITDAFTQCSDCRRKFTKDPKAAGWHQYAYDDDEWKCQSCYIDDFNYISNHYNKKSCELGLGFSDQYKVTKQAGWIAKRIKQLAESKENPLELELWREMTRHMDRTTYGDGHSMGEKYLPAVRELVGWVPFPAPPETVRI